jgi:prepilin-type N-terminal cleavage/methylation domain-containing protein
MRQMLGLLKGVAMRRKAFTLIELLVVISIIALLLSILMPGLQKAKKTAKAVLCKSNLHSWTLTFNMYTEDNNGSFHAGFGTTVANSNWWMDSARDYYGDVDEIRACPSAIKVMFNKDGTQGPGFEKMPFAAWGIVDWFGEDYGSYGVNGWVENKPDEYTTDNNQANFWRKTTAITGALPSNIPLITDAQWIDAWPNDNSAPAKTQDQYWSGASHMVRVVQDRHDKRQNMAFIDGSIEKIDLKRMWKLKWHRQFNTNGIWTEAGGATRDKWETAAPWMADYKDY